jgi:hypothetical protein
MLIFEVENSQPVDSGKLLALSQFLSGRAADTNARKQISTTSFIQLANSLGVNVTPDTIGDLIAKEPLSNVLEPFDPNSNVINFKGSNEPTNSPMDTNQAQQVVDQNAKAAMKRGMNK